jgi:hypothetical protein
MVKNLQGVAAGTSTVSAVLNQIRNHQLGYIVVSKPTAKGRMVVLRPK